MQERNGYDYIVIYFGINDVGNLIVSKIKINMENCFVDLKYRWLKSMIVILGLIYVLWDISKNQFIDKINCYYERICIELFVGVIFIDNKRVMCGNYGNLIE